jgi:putative hydrolase of the HAD superfamily
MNLWVFDNDGTLYDDTFSAKEFTRISSGYYSKVLGISLDKITDEIDKLKDKWGTEFSIVAVAKEHGIDFAAAVENTYLALDLTQCGIKAPDQERMRILNSLPGRKIVFTNNPSVWARKVLSYTGLADCFSDFIGMEEITRPKPASEAYQAVEERHEGFDRIILCDDSLKNLEAARLRGWTTVWHRAGSSQAEKAEGHITISSFDELDQFL